MKNKESENFSLNYLDLINDVFEYKKTILVSILICLTLGIIIAVTSPKEYLSRSYVILETENQMSNSLGQMGALAGMAGINLPQLQGETVSLAPEFYPDIIHSRDFLLYLMKRQFYFDYRNDTMTLEDYYMEERPTNAIQKSISFMLNAPSRIAGLLSSDKEGTREISTYKELGQDNTSYINPTSQEMYVAGILKNKISIDTKSKLVTITASMPEPLISAQVNVLVLDRLLEYVTEYKTAKQRRNLSFIEERTSEAEQKFYDSQYTLASFRDANQGMVSQRAKTKEEQLQLEFNVAFNVYNGLKQELEQANIQLKREMPFFTMLERPSVPLGNYKPNKPLIIIASLFLGALIGVLIALLKILYRKVKEASLNEQYPNGRPKVAI